MKIRARALTKLPASLEASGGLKVVKSNGIWTFSPDWSVLVLETSLPDAANRQLWVLNPQTGVYTRLTVQALLDNIPPGPAGDDGSLIFVQNSAPSTSNPEGSIWVDADSADLDLYRLISSVWTDTGVNLKGATGATGPSYAGTSTSSQTIGNTGTKTFTTQAGLAYQVGTRVRTADTSNPTVNWMEGIVTSYSSTTLAFTADKSAGSGTLTNWTINLAGQPGADGAGTGDVTAASNFGTDNRLIRSDGTGKGVQSSGITVDDSNNVTGINTIAFNNPGAISSTDLDNLKTNGAFIGQNLTNAPGGSSAWHYVLVNGATNYVQWAIPLSGSTQVQYMRQFSGGVWTAWSTFAFTTTVFPTIELGATDTTLSRSAAGIIAVEGVDLAAQILQTSLSAATTLTIAHANRHILHPSSDNNARTFTIPANSSVAYPIGTTLTFINKINTVTIAINTDTLTLAGAGSTGSRTLAANGMATAIKIASTEWMINGTGLT